MFSLYLLYIQRKTSRLLFSDDFAPLTTCVRSALICSMPSNERTNSNFLLYRSLKASEIFDRNQRLNAIVAFGAKTHKNVQSNDECSDQHDIHNLSCDWSSNKWCNAIWNIICSTKHLIYRTKVIERWCLIELVTHVHIPLAKLKQMSDEKRDPLLNESEQKTNTKTQGIGIAHFDFRSKMKIECEHKM